MTYIHYNRYAKYILVLRAYTATDTINIVWYYVHVYTATDTTNIFWYNVHTQQQIRQIYFGITCIHCNRYDKYILVLRTYNAIDTINIVWYYVHTLQQI
jgi:hypothetical protein